jgi:hypothetical protein
MIVSMHVAIGAAAGGATGSRRLAVFLGPMSLPIAFDTKTFPIGGSRS